MFPLLKTKVGKDTHYHKALHDHIFSFLQPTQLRIARYVFRDIPLPRGWQGSEWDYVESLVQDQHPNLLEFEIDEHGIDPMNALGLLFKKRANATIIVKCILALPASDQIVISGFVDNNIAFYNRKDVMERLDQKNYMWNVKSLCRVAFRNDNVAVLKRALKEIGPIHFGETFWTAVTNARLEHDWFEFPHNVLTVVLNAGYECPIHLQSAIRKYYLRTLMEKDHYNKEYPGVENRIIQIGSLLFADYDYDDDDEDYDEWKSIKTTPLCNRIRTTLLGCRLEG